MRLFTASCTLGSRSSRWPKRWDCPICAERCRRTTTRPAWSAPRPRRHSPRTPSTISTPNSTRSSTLSPEKYPNPWNIDTFKNQGIYCRIGSRSFKCNQTSSRTDNYITNDYNLTCFEADGRCNWWIWLDRSSSCQTDVDGERFGIRGQPARSADELHRRPPDHAQHSIRSSHFRSSVTSNSPAHHAQLLFGHHHRYWGRTMLSKVQNLKTKTGCLLQKKKSPGVFQQWVELLKIINECFYGPSIDEKISDEMLPKIQSLLKLHGSASHQLIHNYQLERMKTSAEDCGLGSVTVRALFVNESLTLDILNARNLKPTDSGASADPYLKVQLMPSDKFPDSTGLKSKVHKNTLFPLFEETFSRWLCTPSTIDLNLITLLDVFFYY